MTTLQIAGWKKGMNTVALMKAVQHHSTGSLATAKTLVEDLLAGKEVVLEFADEDARESFRREAAQLGAICR